MFWLQRPPATRLRRLLASPPSRPEKALAQLQKLLSANPGLDLNAKLKKRRAEPALPLTLALGDAWVRTGCAARAVTLLLDAGAVPTWPADSNEVCHYALALERGAVAAAEEILQRSVAAATAAAAGDPAAVAAALGEITMPVIRTALFMDENTAAGGKRQGGDTVEGSAVEASEEEVDPAIMTDAMGGAAWLIDSAPREVVAALRPGGAASLVHALLSVFAERVDSEALKKHALSVSLAAADPVQRAAKEAAASERRSAAVATLLRRLWALLQLALESGSPAVDISVNTFPARPPRPLCDLDKIWDGVKPFATAWLSSWTHESHCMFHPAFREGVRAFALAAARGLGGAGGERRAVRLDGALVEKIVGFMSDDQRAWVETIGGSE
jgi:hypothetical protein